MLPSVHGCKTPPHMLAAQAMGADLAYLGTRFTASKEGSATEGNKQCIIESSGEEIVYTNLFTGVHGNYLKRSIAAAGLDPDALPEADKSKMNFGSGGNMKVKAWRDIWGAGQGVGQIFDAPPAAEADTLFPSIRNRGSTAQWQGWWGVQRELMAMPGGNAQLATGIDIARSLIPAA